VYAEITKTGPRRSTCSEKGVQGATVRTRLGPGLITGAADDDPSGFATNSQVGAEFGFAMLFSFPLMGVRGYVMKSQIERDLIPAFQAASKHQAVSSSAAA
jgi:hypothetical protein